MRQARLTTLCLRLFFCLCFVSTSAQTLTTIEEKPPPVSTGRSPPQEQAAFRLSPGAQEVARLIGVAELIERSAQLPKSERSPGSMMIYEAMMMRMGIMEAMMKRDLSRLLLTVRTR